METAPLLSSVGGLPGPTTLQDHPAFLRASHSPWRIIPQNVLVILRGFVLAYLSAVTVMVANDKLITESEFTNWRHFFDFAIVSFFLVLVYHIITFSWTFTHLYYPHVEETDGIESYIISAMSLPRNMASLRNQFYFTLFYATAVVFSFMNSTVYWFITRQNDAGEPEEPPPLDLVSTSALPALPDTPFSDLFGEGWFKAFVLINLYGVTSVIMMIEILFFNSVKRPFAIGSHLVGLILFSGLYLGWAAIGKLVTGWFAFDWLDESKVGSQEAVTAYCIGFVLLAPLSESHRRIIHSTLLS
ncbi:unnamed protein product [Clonostachys chloroleuca]|uniref:Uncharacterized protein n=1 Tax=Clonostachys chloroleuca TaxID=1926264 RepID=A0AA35M983_9HYPO|nr:unnamed protein product [Clonostachys chloroleuca]